MEAWECVRLAAPIITRSGDEWDLLQGKKLLERALELDPNYATALLAREMTLMATY